MDKTIPYPVPIDEEPLLRNRFIVRFPKDIDIEPWHIHSVSPMTFDFRVGAWKDITISIMEVISGEQSFNKLMDFFQRGRYEPIEVDLVDGPGVVVYQASITEYGVLEISHPSLDYGKDELYKTTITLSPKTISFGYGDEKVTYSSKEK